MKLWKRLSLHRSIFVKFAVSFVLVGLIPLSALSYLLLAAFSSQVEQYTSNNLEQMMFYMSRNANQMFNNYNDISKIMYTNQDRYDKLMNTLQDEQAELKPDDRAVMDDFLKTILASDRYIQSVFFVRASNRQIFYETKQLQSFDQARFPPDKWAETLRAHEKELAFFSTHAEPYFLSSGRQGMTFARNLIDTSTTLSANPKVVGTLYFDVDVSGFDDLFADIKLGKADTVQIVDSDQVVIYSNRKQTIGTKYSDTLDEQDANTVFVKARQIPDARQQLVGRFSKQDFLSGLSKIEQYLAVVAVLCVLSLIVMSLAFSRRFSRPIRGIIQVMSKVESGNLEVSVPIRSEDELGQLAHGFNRMTNRLNQFINEAYVAELGRKQAELHALKGQIRPHYLYNTLEVVRMSAVANDDMPVADMIHALSNQLKYVLDYGEDLVPIGEELRHLDDYFHLIRSRFDDRIELETVVDPAITPEWAIMKLSIQPLVENAVQHGLRPKGNRGKIRLTIEKAAEEQMIVTVYDDGAGMSDLALDELRRLLRGDTRDNELRKHVGLKNVNDRLQSLFGSLYGLEIASRQHVGTSVQYRMPIIKEGVYDAKRYSG